MFLIRPAGANQNAKVAIGGGGPLLGSAIYGMPAGATEEALPILADFSYIRPWAGKDRNASLNAVPAGGRSYNIQLRNAGLDQAWGTLRIGLVNYGAAYNVVRCYVGRQGVSSITEDQTTGFLTVAASPVAIAAGDYKGKTTWIADGIPLTPGANNRFQLALELSEGAPIATFGEFPTHQGIGWIPTYQEQLTNNLSTGFNLAGDRAWDGMPLLVVEFQVHPTNIVSLPFNGDSTTYAMGDGDQPLGRPLGIPGRLESRWRTAGVKIAPVNIGHPGYDTAEYNDVIEQMIADGYKLRVIDRQVDSVNSVTRGKPTTDINVDLLAAEALMAPQPVIHRLGPGGSDLVDHASDWQAGTVTERTWVKTNRPDTVNAGIETTVTNAATLAINATYFFDETSDVHLSQAGYTQAEADMHARIKTILDTLAGETL